MSGITIVLVSVASIAVGFKILSHAAKKHRAVQAKDMLLRPDFLENIRKEEGEESWRHAVEFIINTLNDRVNFQYRSRKEGYFIVATNPASGIGETFTYYFPGHDLNGNYGTPDCYFKTREQAVDYFYGTLVPEILGKLKEENRDHNEPRK
jgi:hypothetical protein